MYLFDYMPKNNTFPEYVVSDVLSEVGGVTTRAMFGGYCVYKDGIVFGIIGNDELFFKVSETNIEDYKKAGSYQFEYTTKKGKTAKMNYWHVPDEVLEDKHEIVLWVNKAVKVALEKKK